MCDVRVIERKSATVTITENDLGWLIEGKRRGQAKATFRLRVPRCDCEAGHAKRLNRPVTICGCTVRGVRQVLRDASNQDYRPAPRSSSCKRTHCANNGHAEIVARLADEIAGTYR